jgi:CheY-like chemotaxis protein
MTGTSTYHLLLADDDSDDCIFFREALEDLPFRSTLTTVNDGVELMQHLNKKEAQLPDLLFLDLNMPRKNGFECLEEINLRKNLAQLPVIIFSTSYDPAVINLLYENGARYYIRKPAEFAKLKQAIHTGISLASVPDWKKPSKEDFVLSNV